MKVIFLYTEIAGYWVASVRDFLDRFPMAEIHVVRYPVNQEAPFDFSSAAGLFFYNRSDFKNRYDLLSFCKHLQADVILCSGWIDKDYLAVAKAFRSVTTTVLVLDTQWKASAKQRLLSLASRFTLKNWFSKVWVPGEQQRQYALKLGFDNKDVFSGFYCADVSLYSSAFFSSQQAKYLQFPKKLLCVARYIPAKNLSFLWEVFLSILPEFPEWELICLGQGEGYEDRIIHPAIRHEGFVQPEAIDKFISEAGVFVLPSLYEPWGVVVHEYAAAGLPLFLSKEVGASSAFLEEGINGYSFDPKNKVEAVAKLRLMLAMSQQQWIDFSEHSRKLAALVSPEKWSQTLASFCTKQDYICVE